MLRENNWIAFPDIRNSRISVKVGLPFDIEKDLELNISRVGTMMQLGGIRSLEVRTEDRNMTRFGGTFLGNDGESALAGQVSSEIIPTYDFFVQSTMGDEMPLKGNKWLDAKLTVHTGEVKRKLMDGRKNVGDKKLWVHEIDSAVRHGLMKTGIGHLMAIKEIPSYERVAIAVGYLMSIIYIDHQPTLISPLIAGSVINFSRSLLFQKEMLGSGYRGSTLMGVEADRALALGVYGLVKPVVRTVQDEG